MILSVRLSFQQPTAQATHPPSESFDGAQDERRGFDIFEDFSFMLRLSWHSERFFSNLLLPSRFRDCENVELSAWNVVATGETQCVPFTA